MEEISSARRSNRLAERSVRTHFNEDHLPFQVRQPQGAPRRSTSLPSSSLQVATTPSKIRTPTERASPDLSSFVSPSSPPATPPSRTDTRKSRNKKKPAVSKNRQVSDWLDTSETVPCPLQGCGATIDKPRLLQHLNAIHGAAPLAPAEEETLARAGVAKCPGTCGKLRALNKDGNIHKHSCDIPRAPSRPPPGTPSAPNPHPRRQGPGRPPKHRDIPGTTPPSKRVLVSRAIRERLGVPLLDDIPVDAVSLPVLQWRILVASATKSLGDALQDPSRRDEALKAYASFCYLGFFRLKTTHMQLPPALPDPFLLPPVSGEQDLVLPQRQRKQFRRLEGPDRIIQEAAQASLLAAKGRPGAAADALQGCLPADSDDPSTREAIKAKFPDPYNHGTPTTVLPPPPPPPALSPDEHDSLLERMANIIIEYVHSRPYESSGAWDGWTYDKLKIAIPQVPLAPDHTALAFVSLVTSLLQGHAMDTPIHRALLVQKGIALQKGSSPSAGIRPICVVSPIVRICSHVLVSIHGSDLSSNIHPLDLGSSKGSGIEALARGIQSVLDWEPESVIIEIDITNAFNTLDRAAIRALIGDLHEKDKLPAPHWFLPWFDFLMRPADVIFPAGNPLRVKLEEGVPQGEPLSPYWYDLWVSHALAPIRHQFHQSVIIAGCHDGLFIISKDPSAAVEAFGSIRDTFATAHQVLNPNKCRVLYPTSSVLTDSHLSLIAMSTDIPRSQFSTEGIIVAGTPVGTVDFVTREAQSIADSITLMCQKLMEANKYSADPVNPPNAPYRDIVMTSAQGLINTLRLCAPARFDLLLRTLPLRISHPIASALDETIRNAALAITDLSLSPVEEERFTSELLMALPTRLGGLGLRRLSMMAAPASIASWASTGRTILDLFIPHVADDSLSHDIREFLTAMDDQPESVTELPTLGDMDRVQKLDTFLSEFGASLFLAFETLIQDLVTGYGYQPPQDRRSPLELLPPEFRDSCACLVDPFGILSGKALFIKNGSLIRSKTFADKLQHRLSSAWYTCVEKTVAGLIQDPEKRSAFSSHKNRVSSTGFLASPALSEHRMPDPVFRCVFANRGFLNLTLPTNGGQEPFPCDAPLNSSENGKCNKPCTLSSHHAFHCASPNIRGARTAGHAYGKDALDSIFATPELRRLFTTSYHGQRREPLLAQFFSRSPTSPEPDVNTRADAIALEKSSIGAPSGFLLDVTFVTPPATHTHPPSEDSDGNAAVTRAEQAKLEHYNQRFVIPPTHRIKVLPIALDVYGAAGAGTERFISMLASRAYPPVAYKTLTGEDAIRLNPLRAPFIRRLRQTLAVAAFRRQALSVYRWIARGVPDSVVPAPARRILTANAD